MVRGKYRLSLYHRMLGLDGHFDHVGHRYHDGRDLPDDPCDYELHVSCLLFLAEM